MMREECSREDGSYEGSAANANVEATHANELRLGASSNEDLQKEAGLDPILGGDHQSRAIIHVPSTSAAEASELRHSFEVWTWECGERG